MDFFASGLPVVTEEAPRTDTGKWRTGMPYVFIDPWLMDLVYYIQTP